MAVQKPLILVGGQVQQIPIGDTLSVGASAVAYDTTLVAMIDGGGAAAMYEMTSNRAIVCGGHAASVVLANTVVGGGTAATTYSGISINGGSA